jgi:hypothetical protein
LGYSRTPWFDPRQVLLDGKIKKLDLKLGLQQVVWGQADGLRVLDVINPLDYREFILEDFLDSRRPFWMVRADLPLGKAALQVVWAPYFAPGRLAVPGNEFGVSPGLGFELSNATGGWAQLPLRVEKTVRPGYKLNASQAGARYTAVGSRVESQQIRRSSPDPPSNGIR